VIGKTALAFTAAAFLATAAALFVAAAGFACFSWLKPSFGEAGASAFTALAAGVVIAIALGVANWRHTPPAQRAPAAPSVQPLVTAFSESIGDHPLLTLGLTALTGFAATRDPALLQGIWAAVLRGRERPE
jgi:hypothetical protein